MIINLPYKLLGKSFIFCFITLVIMNSIKSYPLVEFIGTYGKLGIIILSIVIFLPFLNQVGFSVRLRFNWAYLIIYSLLVIFSLVSLFENNEIGNLVYNVLLIFYLFFYFFMIKILWGVYFKEKQLESFENMKIVIIKIYRSALFWNLILWFSLALINNIDLSDGFNDFGGFFQDKIHFGLFATTGFLVCFYMRYNNIERDTSKFNLFQILLYAVFALYTSRNAVLIVVIAPLYYFIIFKVKNFLYTIPIVISPIIIT